MYSVWKSTTKISCEENEKECESHAENIIQTSKVMINKLSGVKLHTIIYTLIYLVQIYKINVTETQEIKDLLAEDVGLQNHPVQWHFMSVSQNKLLHCQFLAAVYFWFGSLKCPVQLRLCPCVSFILILMQFFEKKNTFECKIATNMSSQLHKTIDTLTILHSIHLWHITE